MLLYEMQKGIMAFTHVLEQKMRHESDIILTQYNSSFLHEC